VEVVFKSDDVMPVMASEVEVAFVVVERVPMRLSMTLGAAGVELAKKAVLNQVGVVVALVLVPYVVARVQGQEKVLAAVR
jgi:hypothetical protein